jgi:hypothetical protein
LFVVVVFNRELRRGAESLSPLVSIISRRSRPFKRDSVASGPLVGVSVAGLRSAFAPRARFMAGGLEGGDSVTGFGVERNAAGSIELS